MPRLGLGRWLVSWIARPFVSMMQPFERLLSVVRGVDPTVSASVVAGAYRTAEKQLDLAPDIEAMDRHAPWPVDIMDEDMLGRARNYLVRFQAQVFNTETGERYMSERLMYSMKQLSASEYEAEYLSQFAGDPYEEGESLEGVKAVNVTHNYRLGY